MTTLASEARGCHHGRMRMRWLVPVLAVAMLSGCHVVLSLNADPRGCLPELAHATPSSAPAGSVITVSAPAANCDLEYYGEIEYTVGIANIGTGGPDTMQKFMVQPDGSFTVDVEVPADLSPGEAYVHIAGSRYVTAPCLDNASCATYDVSFTVDPD